jgi:transposase
MNAFTLYIGIDWATQTHQICVMDAHGTIAREHVVQHTGDSIREFLRWLEAFTSEPGNVAVAIEVPRGPVVEAFLERGYAVFAINPKQLDRFRDRHSVAGAKDDRRDAFVLADSLRTDQHCFRQLSLEPATIVRLRELARAEHEAGEDLRRGANQLFQLLLRYYPQILELCPFPDEPWIWALLVLAPTPQRGRALTLVRLRNLLAKHRIRRLTAEDIREVLSRSALPVAAGVAEAVSERVLLMLPHLRVLYQQRRELIERVDTLLKRISTSDDDACGTLHRDVAILLSIPGVGRAISATLISEAFDALAQRDHDALRTYGGTAPVTRRSGSIFQSRNEPESEV